MKIYGPTGYPNAAVIRHRRPAAVPLRLWQRAAAPIATLSVGAWLGGVGVGEQLPNPSAWLWEALATHRTGVAVAGFVLACLAPLAAFGLWGVSSHAATRRTVRPAQ